MRDLLASQQLLLLGGTVAISTATGRTRDLVDAASPVVNVVNATRRRIADKAEADLGHLVLRQVTTSAELLELATGTVEVRNGLLARRHWTIGPTATTRRHQDQPKKDVSHPGILTQPEAR